MKAIEINSRTDKKGLLKINYPLRQADKKVRVLILVEEDSEEDEERIWLEAVSKSPAFNFLYEKEEDIYSDSKKAGQNTRTRSRRSQEEAF